MSHNFTVLANILEFDKSKELPGIAEKLQYGSTMLLLGIATVFSVLAIIWLSLLLFKVFLHDLPQKKKVKEISAPIVQAAPVAEATDDGEIVAVIAAAIAMAESEGNGLKFRVVSFRKV